MLFETPAKSVALNVLLQVPALEKPYAFTALIEIVALVWPSIIGRVTTPVVVAGRVIGHEPSPLERTYALTAGEAVTFSKTTRTPVDVRYAFLITGAAGTAYVLAVTCGEVSTTSADVVSARALTTAEIRRRRDLPWACALEVCVITGGYSHEFG